MSGIAGIIGRGSLDEARRMGAAMAHRGSHQRVWSPGPGVHFVEAGHDVLAGSSNALALTSAVREAKGSLVSPTSLVDRLQRDAGECLRNLRGNFALAYYDPGGGGRVTLAGDALEYRTLYVIKLLGRWAFASDYKSLLALDDCPALVDRDALQLYLSSMARDLSRPLLNGAVMIPRGEMAKISGDALAIESYVRLPPARLPATPRRSAQSLRSALELVVGRYLEDQTSVAATLSGGLDSTALVALIRHVRPDVKISTYTIGFGPDDPEIVGARRSAEHFKTEHNEVYFDNSELVHLLPRYVWLTEDLAGCGEAILQQKVVQRIDPGTRMLFAGHGADTTFTGMPRHRLMWLAKHMPHPLRGGLGELLKYSQTREMPGSWLGRRLIQRAYGEAPRQATQVIGALPMSMPDERMDLCNYMRASWNMMNTFQYHEPAEDCAGLACVMPFIEAEVRDLAQATPISHMITARYQKKILRDALSDLLPDSLRNRPKAIQRLRRDQSLSDALFTIAKKFDIRNKLTDRRLLATGDIDAVLRPTAGLLSDTAVADLWTLVCAELWMQTFSDGRGRAPLGQPVGVPEVVREPPSAPSKARPRVA